MSRGRFPQFNAAARSWLEADVGPVDDEPCGVGPCDEDVVYRVSWPSVGGDVAYCGFHLARYLGRDLFGHGIGRLKDRDDPDFEKGDQRLVRDEKVSEPGEMIRDRIQGIDRLSVAAVWMQVERELDRTPEEGRDAVILGPDGEPTGRSQGSTASQKLAAMADGGEDE